MGTAYLHGAIESIPGNELNAPTLSTKVIYVPAVSFGPALNPTPMDRDDEMRGLDEPQAVIPELFRPSWDTEVRLYPDLTGFFLTLILGQPVTTAGNGVITDPDTIAIPVGAYRHVWTAPYGPTGLSPLTAQWRAAYRDEGVYFRLKGAAIGELAIANPAEGGSRLTASGPALFMERTSDPALTPTYESLAIFPFMRRSLAIVTWLTGTATTEEFGVTITNPLSDPWPSMGAGGAGFADIIEKGDGPITVTGSIPKRALDADDYDGLLAATGFTVKVRWTSAVNIGATGYPYKLYLEGPNGQYVDGGPEAMTAARRHGQTFDFKLTNASGAAGSSKFTLINATPSYL